MTKASPDSGFTLVETLMAVFALALLMSAGSALLLTTLNSNRLLDERLSQLAKLEVATAHLRADLSAVVPRVTRSARAFEDGKSFYGGLPDRESIVLGLVRSGWTNIANEADRGELLAVDYRYSNGELVRRIYQSPDRTRRTPVSETVLVDNLAGLEVAFTAGGVTSQEWELVLEAETPILPDAVTIVLEFETGETLSQNFLVGGAS